MSNPDDTTDKDFVMSDGDASEDTIDNNGNEIYESVNGPHKKTSSMPSIIAAAFHNRCSGFFNPHYSFNRCPFQDPGSGRKKADIGPGTKA
jgi:hypothetical protein